MTVRMRPSTANYWSGATHLAQIVDLLRRCCMVVPNGVPCLRTRVFLQLSGNVLEMCTRQTGCLEWRFYGVLQLTCSAAATHLHRYLCASARPNHETLEYGWESESTGTTKLSFLVGASFGGTDASSGHSRTSSSKKTLGKRNFFLHERTYRQIRLSRKRNNFSRHDVEKQERIGAQIV